MSDEFDVYEFVVSVWQDPDTAEWLYSVVQEFDEGTDSGVEVLATGSHESALDALQAVSDFIPTIDFV